MMTSFAQIAGLASSLFAFPTRNARPAARVASCRRRLDRAAPEREGAAAYQRHAFIIEKPSRTYPDSGEAFEAPATTRCCGCVCAKESWPQK